MKKCDLWEAVALTLDVDPRGFTTFDMGNGSWNVIPRPTVRGQGDISALGGRLEIAVSYLGDGIDDLTPFSDGHRFGTQISLPNFVTWAQTIWTDLPSEFVSIAPRIPTGKPVSNAERRTGTGVEVLLPHTTKKLDALFEIMRRHWTAYDRENPPKQANVAADIDAALGWNSQKDGQPSRTAQAIAAFIRPDDIADADRRTGRRRPDGSS